MNKEIVVVQYSDGSGLKYEGLSVLETSRITNFLRDELGRTAYAAQILHEPLIPVPEPDFPAESTVHAVTMVGATHVFTTAKDAATYALDAINAGCEDVMMGTLVAPRDMTFEEAADWAEMEGILIDAT